MTCDPKQQFSTGSLSREQIADMLAGWIDDPLTVITDRLTDAVCSRFARRMGEIGATRQPADDMIDAIREALGAIGIELSDE